MGAMKKLLTMSAKVRIEKVATEQMEMKPQSRITCNKEHTETEENDEETRGKQICRRGHIQAMQRRTYQEQTLGNHID